MKLNKRLSIIPILMIMTTLFAYASGNNESTSTNELEDKVVIYSTHGEAMLELVATAFEEETGVKVEFINLKGELADRIRAEKENPQSDIMYGGASSIFMELTDENIFDAYEPVWAEKLDDLFKDKDNYWFGTIQTPVMIFYNSEVITTSDAPKDWSDLTMDKYNNQLVFRNALSSSARATFSSLLQQFEMNQDLESGWDYMKDLDKNTKQYYGSGSLMFQALGRKEASISYATLNSIIDNKVKNNMPLVVVNATSGSPIITDGIALIKNAKHVNAAKAFIDFAGSAKIQGKLAVEFNRMPTNSDALATSPEWMGEIKITPMNVNWADLATKQSDWMQKWDTDIKDSNKDAK